MSVFSQDKKRQQKLPPPKTKSPPRGHHFLHLRVYTQESSGLRARASSCPAFITDRHWLLSLNLGEGFEFVGMTEPNRTLPVYIKFLHTELGLRRMAVFDHRSSISTGAHSGLHCIQRLLESPWLMKMKG
jgi:hypothetical protein